MRIITAQDIDRVLTFPALIEALREGFRQGIVTPLRHHHGLKQANGSQNVLLLMPAWSQVRGNQADFIGVKLVTVFPDNPQKGVPTVQGSYLLFSGDTGAPLAVLDGGRLTLWRTAAASALAATYLARADAARLVMVGAGAMAPFLIKAHAAVRPLRDVLVWNRSGERARQVVAALAGKPFRVRAVSDLEAAVRAADIVSCATVSAKPLVRGDWLKPGTHVDLVGAFRPDLRESDDEVMRRGRIFVDTREGAFGEAGDILQPLAARVIERSHILADLFDLTGGKCAGRRHNEDITVFKSVGTALEDLAGAQYIYRTIAGAA